MARLTVSLAQMDVVTGKPEDNLLKADRFAAEARRRKSDIVCFPEMWTTGLDWAMAAGSAAKSKSVDRASDIAKRHSIWLSGSMAALCGDGKPVNMAALFAPDGALKASYAKTHLFAPMGEDKFMSPGKSLTLTDTPWGKAGLAVCYDLRFPEVFRSYALGGASIIFLSSAFPAVRSEHWEVLIRARAIEDQLFMVATDRVGAEDTREGEMRFAGLSAIIGPSGETVIEGTKDKEELLTATIDLEGIRAARGFMDCLKDRRPELYR